MATRYEHTGNAVPTTLSLSIDADDTTITIADATGWPTGGVGPFWTTIAPGTSAEEKVKIASRSGTTLTVSARGADGTTAASHATPAVIMHTFSAEEADDANELAAQITTLGGTPLTTSAAQTVTNKSVALGSNTVTGTKAQFNAALTDADFATQAGTETLTNKTIDLTDNTLVGTLAELSAAVSDADLVGVATTQTLTNKTLTSPVLDTADINTPDIDGGTIDGATLGTNTLNGALTGTGSIDIDGPIAVTDGATFEVILGYLGGPGLSIGQSAAPTAHPNGIVLWVSGTTLYARKPNGTDVVLG